jgi:hypothetical protein
MLINRMPQKRAEKGSPKNAPQPKRAKRGATATATSNTAEQGQPRSSPPPSTERLDVQSLIPYGKQPVEPSIAKLLMAPLHTTSPVAKYINQKAAKLFENVTVGHAFYLIYF